jgi:hypothetical protein
MLESRELLRKQRLQERDDQKLEPLRLEVVKMVEAGNRQALLLQKRLITPDLYSEELFLEANKIVDEGLVAVEFNARTRRPEQ